jgi:hypothetical protein
MLNCGLHKCPQHCHQISDHSKMLCQKIIEFKCPNNHLQKRKCHKSNPAVCRQCELDDERRQRKLEAELERQNRRDQIQAKYTAKMTQLDQEIRLLRDQAADIAEAEERANALEQKKQDLEAAKQLAQSASQSAPSSSRSSAQPATQSKVIPDDPKVSTMKSKGAASSSNTSQNQSPQPNQIESLVPETNAKSPSELEWERQKRVDNASNDAIDVLMGLTGLEEVKSTFLAIKAKIETIWRQGGKLNKERFGIVMLGNPGTGMLLAS